MSLFGLLSLDESRWNGHGEGEGPRGFYHRGVSKWFVIQINQILLKQEQAKIKFEIDMRVWLENGGREELKQAKEGVSRELKQASRKLRWKGIQISSHNFLSDQLCASVVASLCLISLLSGIVEADH